MYYIENDDRLPTGLYFKRDEEREWYDGDSCSYFYEVKGSREGLFAEYEIKDYPQDSLETTNEKLISIEYSKGALKNAIERLNEDDTFKEFKINTASAKHEIENLLSILSKEKQSLEQETLNHIEEEKRKIKKLYRVSKNNSDNNYFLDLQNAKNYIAESVRMFFKPSSLVPKPKTEMGMIARRKEEEFAKLQQELTLNLLESRSEVIFSKYNPVTKNKTTYQWIITEINL